MQNFGLFVTGEIEGRDIEFLQPHPFRSRGSPCGLRKRGGKRRGAPRRRNGPTGERLSHALRTGLTVFDVVVGTLAEKCAEEVAQRVFGNPRLWPEVAAELLCGPCVTHLEDWLEAMSSEIPGDIVQRDMVDAGIRGLGACIRAKLGTTKYSWVDTILSLHVTKSPFAGLTPDAFRAKLREEVMISLCNAAFDWKRFGEACLQNICLHLGHTVSFGRTLINLDQFRVVSRDLTKGTFTGGAFTAVAYALLLLLLIAELGAFLRRFCRA
eukprot:s362_g20.t1